ncbi:MAG: penicillin acylase family protein [Candidatus Heimdallarchaeota archaeon]|nr:MAG: penicillin acylase family protein [Candidatus Heimdallarchaeota archaeon]
MSSTRDLYKQGGVLIVSIIGILLLIIVLSTPIMGMFALGPIVSPGGIFGAATGSSYPSGSITLEGIDAPVTIIRDNWGVPHIYADTQKDAAFALGYCHATDRMFQMEMTVRTGMGLMSEVRGNDSLGDDIYYLTLGIASAAQEMVDTFETERKTDPQLDTMLDILDAYCDGVNYEINNRINTHTLPIEFQLLNFEPTPWTPLKTFVYNRLMSLMLTYSTFDLEATILRDELFNKDLYAMEELFPLNQTFYQVPIVPTYGTYDNYSLPLQVTEKIKADIQRGDSETRRSLIQKILDRTPESLDFFQQSWIGSNNWVANGTKTVSGKPILANDMHLSIDLPHIWYEAHLVAKNDSWNIYGYTLAGTPVVVVGFNTHIAWGFTNVGPDGVDWFEYVWDGDKYWNGSGWALPIEENVTIPVKGLGDHNVTIRYTSDGVIMDEKGKSMIAMKWTATESPTYEIKALYGANNATNWAEFNQSMQWFHDPPQNVVFADSEGTIALRPTGRFVKRNFTEGLLARFVQNGSDPSVNKDWEYIPFNELPYSVNPDQCYLASANQKSTGPDYQYYLSSTQAAGYRGRSINRHLSEAPDGSIDVDLMKDAQCGPMGILDISAESFTPFFIEAVDQAGVQLSETAEAALTELKSWVDSEDRFLMNKTLVGPTIFYETFSHFKNYTWFDEYEAAGIDVTRPQDNTLEYLVREFPNSTWFDDISTPSPIIEERDDIIVKAFIKAVEELEKEFGSSVDEWLWGDYHQIYFNHLAGIPSFGKGAHPHDGSGYTLLAAGGRPVGSGPSERMVVDFGNISNSWSVIPAGVSGNPANPHYADQALDLWMNGEYHLMLIQYDTVESFAKEDLEATLILKPE